VPETRRSGLRIHYELRGSGPPVVLVHGYTASGHSNWTASGWVEALGARNTLLIPDLRGHGRSEKPHSAAPYSVATMSSDVLAVMDEEGVASAPVFGYSMGGMVTMELLLEHAARVQAAVIGGMGSYFPRGRGRFAFERQHPQGASGRRHLGEAARFFAGYVARLDPIALEACYRGVFKRGRPVNAARLAEIQAPMLVVAGDRDAFFDPARTLADLAPNARFLPLPFEGHLSAIRNPTFQREVAAFLDGVREGTGTTRASAAFEPR
jgi:pimeloyl-ACP methyl ester carboxylesterase